MSAYCPQNHWQGKYTSWSLIRTRDWELKLLFFVTIRSKWLIIVKPSELVAKMTQHFDTYEFTGCICFRTSPLILQLACYTHTGSWDCLESICKNISFYTTTMKSKERKTVNIIQETLNNKVLFKCLHRLSFIFGYSIYTA